MSERELIKRAKNGDFSAFAELIAPEKARIFGLALKMTGNRSDAEDVMQDSLIKAIDNIDRFREESSFGTWLYSIALNQARSLIAKQKQIELKPIEDYLPAGTEDDLHGTGSQRLFDWQDPHKLLENQELRTIIEQGLSELPPKYREAFLLRYYEQLSIKEIAELIGESVAAAKSRVLRARLALRDHLSKAFEDSYGKKVS